jgi:malic enzyme
VSVRRLQSVPAILRVTAGISIGKLSLYIACAGISPERTLPVVLDLGTNNKVLLEDPLYLGLRQPRMSAADTCAFVSEFVEAYHAQFPKAVLQFEDFSNDTWWVARRHVYFPVILPQLRYPCTEPALPRLQR